MYSLVGTLEIVNTAKVTQFKPECCLVSPQVSAGLAEDGADVDKLMARMDELQTQIDAANGWEIERTLQRATDALRCPPGPNHEQMP